ncbi:hypothetical protein ACIBSV_46740 [Embleya sp. NPDC050154]|uniref:hypothetical protein n=1 Tax=Embleya sp. NPDC050154 TaxID=3363988 RepID=UPI0037B950D5
MAADSKPAPKSAEAAATASETPTPSPNAKAVTLRTGGVFTRFDPGDGLDTVTRDGTNYTRKNADRVHEAAARYGVPLTETTDTPEEH